MVAETKKALNVCFAHLSSVSHQLTMAIGLMWSKHAPASALWHIDLDDKIRQYTFQ